MRLLSRQRTFRYSHDTTGQHKVQPIRVSIRTTAATRISPYEERYGNLRRKALGICHEGHRKVTANTKKGEGFYRKSTGLTAEATKREDHRRNVAHRR